MQPVVYSPIGSNGLASFEEHDKSLSPLLVLRILGRRKLLFISIGVALSAICVAGISTLHPSYVATSSVLIQERKDIVPDLVTSSGTIATDSVAVRTQADILRSSDLARTVARELDLLHRPIFLSPPAPGWTPWLVSHIRQLGVPPAAIDWLGLDASEKNSDAGDRDETVLRALQGMTTIVNDGRSYVIDIKVKLPAPTAQNSPDVAELSAEIANAYASVYTQFTAKVKSDTMHNANLFFDQRVLALQQRVQNADDAVQTYRIQSGLIDDRAASHDGGSVTIANQQMAQVSSDLVSAITERTRKEASLQQITLAKAGQGDLQSVPEIVASPLIQSLRQQQAALSAKEASLATSRGPSNPELVAVRASQRDAAEQIAAETAKISASLRTSADAARAREVALRSVLGNFQTEVGSQGRSEVKLRELQNAADIARVIYSAYLKRAQEVAAQIDLRDPDALIVSHAGIPIGPAPPSKHALDAAGAIFSFFLSSLICLVRERLQAGFRTSEQVESELGLTSLGFVPRVKNLRSLSVFKNSNSNFSQALYSVRALLKLNMHQDDRVVMVTSAVAQEGKTVFASSLARNAALAGQAVLLIDFDLRRPAVTRNIETNSPHSVGEIALRRDKHSSLDVMSPSPGTASPQDLFASNQMRDIMVAMRERYDLIVIDTPPILVASDARVLSRLADITVFVVRWQKTPQLLASAAVNALKRSGAKIAGVVVTQVPSGEIAATDGGYAYKYGRSSKPRLV